MQELETTVEIDVTVRGSIVPFQRGRYSGPPEDCYPDEGGFCEDVAVVIRSQHVNVTGKIEVKEVDITEYLPQKLIDSLGDDLYDSAK